MKVKIVGFVLAASLILAFAFLVSTHAASNKVNTPATPTANAVPASTPGERKEGSRDCVCGEGNERPATCQDIAVPATSQWNTAVSDAPLSTGRVRVLIMNPNSGPGTSINQDYVTAVNRVHAAGTEFLVYGYVYTSYGQRSLASVEADIDNYHSWYGVDGIFVDETASSSSLISTYYQPLANYITSQMPGSDVMLNPGVYPDQGYLNITVPSPSSLIVNVFEGTYGDYVNATVPSWAFSYPDISFSHLVYSTSATQMPNAVALSAQRNVGWIYVTDGGLPNPWAALPSYWSSLISQTEGGCS